MSDMNCILNDKSMSKIKEAVCIDTNRVYDSCADKDCLENLQVYFTDEAQAVIDTATNVRPKSATVLNVYIEVEKVPFNKGFYSVNLTYYFKICFDVFTGPQCQPLTICGLTSFTKKCILYGSEGNVKVFSSEFSNSDCNGQLPMTTTNPRAKVQTVDPVCLDAKIFCPQECCFKFDCCCNPSNLPKCVCRCFEGNFSCCEPNEHKVVTVTLGIFTIIQLERDVQMLIPAYDFCIPKKECQCSDTDNPCEVFRQLKFPVDEFFPPKNDQKGPCCK